MRVLAAALAFALVPALPVFAGDPPKFPQSLSASPQTTAGAWTAPAARAEGMPAVAATAATLLTNGATTTFQLDLTKGVRVEVFTLANPYRVIVDLPDVTFKLPDGTGQKGAGLVRTFRYGLFEAGKARIVLDTPGPVVINKAEMTAASGAAVRLSVVMAPTDAAKFGAGTGAQKAPQPDTKPGLYEDAAPSKPKNRAKPVIIIDPGHGGIDPGAVAASNLLEKNVVLAVARLVKAKLKASGNYEVKMTRETDVFISLDNRLKLSRQHSADLFISIHADSLDASSVNETVRGASVYTLSDRASDEQARKMAEKENASDLLAGLEKVEAEGKDDVKGILIDLMKRETADFSTDFSNELVSKLRRQVSMQREAQKSAAFKVLRQTQSPSVLIELGYLSNTEDEKLLSSGDWQGKVAKSISDAVDVYFAKRTRDRP